MIDLTQHVLAAALARIRSLKLSDCAAAELSKRLSLHAPAHSDPQKFGPIVATSVVDFLTSDYFLRSAWFRCQSVHSVAAFVIATASGKEMPICHIVCAEGQYTLVAASECALPDGYFERRLLEEVRVECGIGESAEHPKGRSA